MSCTAAVTGAGGYVGSRLIKGLARRGWTVMALTSRPEHLEREPGIEAVKCAWQARELERVLSRLGSVPFWIHAAARLDFSDQDVMALYRDNALLTERLARLLAETSRSSRLVYVSTLGVFGKDQALSTQEEPRPSSHYGLSKLLGERVTAAHLGERAAVLRLHGVWGRGGNLSLYINRCLNESAASRSPVLKGTGSGKRNFIWVDDLAGIVAMACEEGWSGVHPVGARESLSTREMVEAIAARFGVPVRYEQAEGPDADRVVPVPARFPSTPFRKALDVEARALGKAS